MLETVSNASSSALGQVSINPLADWFESLLSSYMGISGIAADVLSAAVVLAVFLIISEIARHFVTDVAPHLVSKTESTLDDEMLNAIKGPVQALFIVAGVYLACKTLNGLSLGIIGIMDKLATIGLILVGAYFVANLISGLIKWYVHDVAPKTDSDLDDHLMPFIRKFLVAVVYLLAAVMIIGLFTDITPLIASLGIFGVAVALAAKEALSNLFGAFAILTDRPYKVGDRLYLDGVGPGDVVDVGLRSTRVRTTDSRIVVVPNEKIAASRIVNLSQPDTKVRKELKICIAYGSDADRACALMESIAAGTPGVSKDPKPRAYVSELGDFAVTIMLLVYIDSYISEWIVPDTIYRQTLAAFKKEGIEIPYPVVTVQPKFK